MTDPAVPADPADPAAVQADVAAARARLLSGRGTGASRAEIDARTRARSQLTGEPTPQHLAAVARQTAIARGDAAAIALDVAVARDQLAVSVQAIRARVSPSRVVGRQVRTVREVTAAGWVALRATGPAGVAAGAGMALTVTALLNRRRRRRRPGSRADPPRNRPSPPTRRR